MNRISFIIPVYDSTISQINDCLESIKGILCESDEIIIVNDGSDDKKLNDHLLLLSYKEKNIKYIYQENQGSAVARNKGIEIADSRFIMFVDVDDLLIPGELKDIIDKLDKKIDISIFDYCVSNKNGTSRKTLGNRRMLTPEKQVIQHNILYCPSKYDDFVFGSIWGKCFSTQFIKENNLRFSNKLRKAQDRIFMLECISKAKEIEYIPICAYEYRLNRESITHKLNFKMIDYYCYLKEEASRYVNTYDLGDYVISRFTYVIFNELLNLTSFNIQNKESLESKKKMYNEIFYRLGLKESLNILKFSDFKTHREKIRFCLIKNHCFLTLYTLNRKELIKVVKADY